MINNEVENLVSTLGQIGDARLLLMTCLIIADKLEGDNKDKEQEDYNSYTDVKKKLLKE